MIKTDDGFPSRLKVARQFRGFSQAQLARKSKIPSSSISHFEAGLREPSLNSFRSICYALNIDAEYLLCRSKYCIRPISDKLTTRLSLLNDDDFEFISKFIEAKTK